MCLLTEHVQKQQNIIFKDFLGLLGSFTRFDNFRLTWKMTKSPRVVLSLFDKTKTKQRKHTIPE